LNYEPLTTNHKQISIFGCGWIGLPLAQLLLQNGYEVLGSTTTSEKLPLLVENGIKAFQLNFALDTIPTDFLESNVWVIAFPPKSKSTDGNWYFQAIKQIAELAKSYHPSKMILLSTTSVYPDSETTYTEEFEITESNTGNLSIFQAEQCILKSNIEQKFVLRLGGLAGANRFLARHFSGKSDLKGGNHPVNLLHQDDAIHAITHFIENEVESGIYNVCSPMHPTRKELYTLDCQRFGLPLPYFKDERESSKIISSEKIRELYTFKYADPLEFEYTFQ
jgi:nucleoside-diphosphate-sugar epimerase